MSHLSTLKQYFEGSERSPLFLKGDAVEVLKQFPKQSVDCVMTSPPYWGHRRYAAGGIGQESKVEDYVDSLLSVFAEVHRVLCSTGSLWLDIGDSYQNKAQVGVPWRVAFALMDRQGWILRNEVIWNKVKGGPDNARDRLRNHHETVFHFVKQTKSYFYDVDAIRSRPREAKVVDGAVVSATGVTGVRYRRQIELSTALSQNEKERAFAALDDMLNKVEQGELSDFRMIMRRQQRTTHSDATAVSGRARELAERGFYFLRYHPKGSKPGDVWDIMPEDSHNRQGHFAPFPEDLCRIPLLATCPPNGVVLDPFCGTGTTCVVAKKLGRYSIGVDISGRYLTTARRRCDIPSRHS